MSSPSNQVVARPSSGSPRKHEVSPPHFQEYSEKKVEGETSKSEHIRKFCIDHMFVDTPTDDYMRGVFDYFDANHSGHLDKKEFMTAYAESFENYGAPMSEKDLMRVFAKVDKSRDGRISYDEFCVLLLERLRL